ncbi:MAG TPA: hypothetical protein VIV60_24820 [Polyangiaceae bacterium]
MSTSQAVTGNASISAALTSYTDRLLADILVEFPRFRLVSKRDSPLSRAIDRCLRLITLGRQNRFLTEYHTVIGETLYLAPSWSVMDDRARYVLLCHERVHLRQRRRFGTVPMALLYLIPILPIGLAIGRAWLEREAYRETLRATAEMYGIEAAAHPALRSSILARFIGPDYGWMWPFPKTVGKWYDCCVDELRGQPATGSANDSNG